MKLLPDYYTGSPRDPKANPLAFADYAEIERHIQAGILAAFRVPPQFIDSGSYSSRFTHDGPPAQYEIPKGSRSQYFGRYRGRDFHSKSQLQEMLVEAALDAGKSVIIITRDGLERRGPNFARDVTPKYDGPDNQHGGSPGRGPGIKGQGRKLGKRS